MKPTLIAASLLSLALSPLMADSTSFTAADVVNGETWTEAGSYASSMTITVFDSARALPPTTTSLTVNRSKTDKILDVGGGSRINSLQVTYSAASLAAVVGKSYKLTVHGNHADVEYFDPADGTPSDAEIAFVQGDNSHFGQFRAMNKIFGGKTFTVGEGVNHINKNDAADLICATDDVSVEDLALTFTGVDGNGFGIFNATLTLNAKMRGNSKPSDEDPGAEKFTGSTVTELSGTIKVNPATCRPGGLDLTGPNTLTGNRSAKGKGSHATMTVNGDGTSTFTFTYAF